MAALGALFIIMSVLVAISAGNFGASPRQNAVLEAKMTLLGNPAIFEN